MTCYFSAWDVHAHVFRRKSCCDPYGYEVRTLTASGTFYLCYFFKAPCRKALACVPCAAIKWIRSEHDRCIYPCTYRSPAHTKKAACASWHHPASFYCFRYRLVKIQLSSAVPVACQHHARQYYVMLRSVHMHFVPVHHLLQKQRGIFFTAFKQNIDESRVFMTFIAYKMPVFAYRVR